MRITMVPGIGGSGAGHWQTAWEETLPDAVSMRPESWDLPDPADWTAALDRAVDGSRSLLVAHSLGCLVAARWTHDHPDRVAGVFLVAPPDRHGAAFPREAAGFDGTTAGPLPVPSVVIASSDDPFCSAAAAAGLAAGWGSAYVLAGALGHINSASVPRSWQQGRDLLTVFAAGLAR